jgi:hypothetical protein
MWIRNTFFHKNNTSTEIQQHNIFFLAGDMEFLQKGMPQAFSYLGGGFWDLFLKKIF